MNIKIRAVGFDLGDTLLFYRDIPLSWVSLYPDAPRSVAARCGCSPTPEQLVSAAEILGRYNTRLVPRTHEVPAAEIFRPILQLWGADPVHLPKAIEAYFEFFRQNLSACEDAIPVLASLRQKNIPAGILTDVPYGMPREFVEQDIEGAGISGLFDVLLTSVEVGLRKPEPAGYLALANRLGIPPQEMLYVGNEPKDVIGASRAGCFAVFLDRADKGGNHGQNETVSTLHAIPEILSRHTA